MAPRPTILGALSGPCQGFGSGASGEAPTTRPGRGPPPWGTHGHRRCPSELPRHPALDARVPQIAPCRHARDLEPGAERTEPQRGRDPPALADRNHDASARLEAEFVPRVLDDVPADVLELDMLERRTRLD